MAIQRIGNNQFDVNIRIIEKSRKNAMRKANEELIMMYWRVGDYYIQSFADFFSQNYPQIKGFNRRGIYRMKQFLKHIRTTKKCQHC